LRNRVRQQQAWYKIRADQNRHKAQSWRMALVAGEVVGIALAAMKAFDVWQVDVSGILAAFVSSGAAWLSLKQHGNLASAYAVAATELDLIVDKLTDAREQDWAKLVADAEEAISREHTMWLASRTTAAG
jgi:hypothetical protein